MAKRIGVRPQQRQLAVKALVKAHPASALELKPVSAADQAAGRIERQIVLQPEGGGAAAQLQPRQRPVE